MLELLPGTLGLAGEVSIENKGKKHQRSRTWQTLEQGTGTSPTPPPAWPALDPWALLTVIAARTQVTQSADVAPPKSGHIPHPPFHFGHSVGGAWHSPKESSAWEGRFQPGMSPLGAFFCFSLAQWWQKGTRKGKGQGHGGSSVPVPATTAPCTLSHYGKPGLLLA